MMRMLSADEVAARVPPLWRAAVTALLLMLGLLVLVEQRARILRGGTEVRLRTVPVDPRDLFRGDYVVLGYEIGAVDAETDGGEPLRRGERVFVTLLRDSDGFARAAGVSRRWPQTSGDAVVIAGHLVAASGCVTVNGTADCSGRRHHLNIAYGLESYFVPQGEGKAIETTDKARIEVVAAVSSSGDAAIKRLLIDGKPLYAEPPY